MIRQAVAILAAALSISPQAATSQDSKENADFKLALNLYGDGLYDLASEQLKQFIATFPATSQGVEARFYLGLTQEKLKQYDDARMTFQTFALSYQDNPKAADAWWQVGECYAALGNSHEAALGFERVKVFHPKSKLAPEALVRSGKAFLQAGEVENARRVLRIVLQEYASSPAVLAARTSLAGIYIREGNLEQAQSELRRVIEGDPSGDARAQALLLLGNIQQSTGRSDQARANFQEIIQNYRSTSAAPGAYFQLGRLSAAAGDYRGAIADFQKSAEAKNQPDSLLVRESLDALGDAKAALRDFPGAVTAYENSLNLSPGDDRHPLLLWKIARASALGKDYGKSNEAATRLLKSGAPDSLKRRARIRLALNAEEQRNTGLAVQLLSSFAQQQPDDPSAPDVLFRAATLSEKTLHDSHRASSLYELLIARYDHSPLIDDALMGVARCQEQQKDFVGAAVHYRRLITDYPASKYVPEAETRITMIDIFEAKDKDSGLEKLALLVGDVVAQKDRAGLAFRLGEIYFSDLKNYQAAAAQMEAALHAGLQGSSAHEARRLRAKALEYLSLRDPSQREKAVDAYEELLAGSSPDANTVEAALSLFALRAQTLDGARSAEEEILKRFPSFPRRDAFALRKAVLLEEADSTNAAREELGRLLQDYPSSPSAEEASFRYFGLLVKAGLTDSSMVQGAAYVSAFPQGPHVATVLALLADRARATGETKMAIEDERLLATTYFYTEEAREADRKLAAMEVAYGNFTEATRIYNGLLQQRRQDVLNEGDIDPELLLAMGRAQYLAGNFRAAKSTLLELLARERTGDQAGEAYITLGMIARSAGALDEAASYFLQASAATPNAPLTPDIAEVLFENGEYSGAAKQYTRLLANARSDSEHQVYASRIILCHLKGDNIAGVENDVAAFAKRYRDDRSDLASFELEKGNFFFRKKDYARAFQSYRLVLARYDDTPSGPWAIYWTARTLEATNKPKDALEQLNFLVKRYPGAPVLARAWLALGNLYYTLEQWDEAVKSYRRIVDDPKADTAMLPLAMSNLIETYETAGTYDAALSLTRKYLELFPNADDELDKRIKIGILYERLGYYDQAVLQLQSLLDEAGSDLEGEIRYYIADANYNKGDYQQAILDFLKVPYLVTKKGKLDWTANSLYMSGQAYEKMGRYDQALTMYQQIVDRSGIDEVFKNAARKEIDRVRLVLKRKGD
jgi:TolA-binding protein